MKTIEERADRAIYEPTDGHQLKACEVVAFARGYELGATEQKAIDNVNLPESIQKVLNEQKWYLIDKACHIFCHTGCPHKRYSYDCLKGKCDTWKIFRKAMEE